MNNEQIFDTIIIGAGPAGLIAAYELKDTSILIVEKGAPIPKRVCPMITDCMGCNRCGEIEGVGGAGGWSDGKLCLGSVGILDQFLGERYFEEVKAVNQVFRDVLQEKYREPNDCVDTCEVKEWLTQEVTEVANLGTSAIRYAFQRLHELINKSGNTIVSNDRVTNIYNDNEYTYTIQTKRGRKFYAHNIIVSTGKCDITVIPQLIERYRLETIPAEPTLGFRLAIPNEELQKMKSFGNNPKLKLHLPNGDTVKTHCFAFGGEVMAYICGDYFLVGGRADYQYPTEFANTNILYKFSSGEPQKRSCAYNTKTAERRSPQKYYLSRLTLILRPYKRTPRDKCSRLSGWKIK